MSVLRLSGTVTRGEQMLALRRRRMAAAHPFFRGGFRPFFFGGPAWAVIALTIWLLSLSGAITIPAAIGALAWHRHEMLFGFVGAVIAGFLLTAIPNWTGRLPIAGWPLAGLFGLWVAARLALLFSTFTGLWPCAILDVGFFLTLGLLAAREVLSANNRNAPVVGMVLLFAVANAFDYLAAAGMISSSDLGWQMAIAIVVLLISLIGGRIIPSFTRNWMVKRDRRDNLPTQPGKFDRAVIGTTAIALLAWLSGPAEAPTGMLVLLAAVLQAVRLARWSGIRTLADPLVFILHVGYAWLPIGLTLLGLSLMSYVPRSAAVHALTAGAMATTILAVMTRASLGHTARELKANTATITLYVLVTVGAVLRVSASLTLIDYRIGMDVAGSAWGAALLLFLVAYAPVLWKPRLGE
ncbi:NnrS family protein [Sphingomonas flavescens]|uniref:NnrS family protein n=1 Tax=Sphingomonas flavescens TaxID=3132797 RepID=UPI002804C804|nr:NnrS family protein [Sphingomonas limnosediminicola]